MEAEDSAAKEALKGHSFVYEEIGQQEKYMKTLKAVAQYCGQVYGNEIRKLVLYGEETEYKDPTPPASDAGTGKVEAYKLEF